MTTYREMMTAAHATAKAIRQQGESYASAFAVALKAEWARLREAEQAAKNAPRQPQAKAKAVQYVLTGRTYEHRAAIKDAGGEWDADRKAWIVEADRKGRLPKDVAGLRGVSWRREEV